MLGDKERLLTIILDSIQDGICLLDEDLRIVRVNPFFERSYVEKMPFLGRKCHEVFWDRPEPCDSCPAIWTLKSGERASKVISSKRDGKEAWYELMTFPLRDKHGSRVKGVIEYVREISERRRMEEELQKSRDFYLTLFDKFPALIWRAGTDKKCDYFNVTWLDFTGRTIEQEVGDGWAEGVHPHDLDCCFRTYVEAFDNQEPFCMEYRLRHHSGQYRWIVDFGQPFKNLEGEFSGYIGTCFDITDRKNAEEKIQRLNNELEMMVEERTRELLDTQEELVRKEKLAILGQISGSVGHELRNPLGVMSNAVYFLKMLHGNDDETTREYLDIIKHEIDKSQKIISDLLDFARIKTPQRKTVTAAELIEEGLERCVIPQNVQLRIELPDSIPPVTVDPQQLGQVFQNLIANAVQAMPEGGRITISAGAESDSGMVRIWVSDRGQGIAPKHMGRLFQPLFTTKPKGIGLGLVVCRNLVEANGGRIEVASEPGNGATFSIRLPHTGLIPEGSSQG